MIVADLEAGYAVNQLTGHVGDKLQITYTLRNTSRAPKPWLEIHAQTCVRWGPCVRKTSRALGLLEALSP